MQRKVIATGFMISGPIIVALLVFFLNRMLISPDSGSEKATTSFQVAAPRPAPQDLPKPPPKRQVKQNSRDQLAPDLSSLLSGSSFGLQQFEWLDTESFSESLMDDIRNATLTAETVEKPPIVVQAAPLSYPPLARRKGIAGHVVVNLLISQTGKVEKTQVLESQPEGVFDEVALQSVRQWQFQPGMDRGQTVAVWVEQKISFSMQ